MTLDEVLAAQLRAVPSSTAVRVLALAARVRGLSRDQAAASWQEWGPAQDEAWRQVSDTAAAVGRLGAAWETAWRASSPAGAARCDVPLYDLVRAIVAASCARHLVAPVLYRTLVAPLAAVAPPTPPVHARRATMGVSARIAVPGGPVSDQPTDESVHYTPDGRFWLATLPPSTYDAQTAGIAARARTRQAVRDGTAPDEVAEQFRYDPESDAPLSEDDLYR